MADRDPPEQTETHLILDLAPEDTEKVWPVGVPERPPPLPRTVEQRPVNLADLLRIHRAEIAQVVSEVVRGEVGMLKEAIHQRSAGGSQPPPASVGRRVAGGVLNGAKYSAIALGALGLAVEIARIWRPDLVGPLQTLVQLFGGVQ